MRPHYRVDYQQVMFTLFFLHQFSVSIEDITDPIVRKAIGFNVCQPQRKIHVQVFIDEARLDETENLNKCE